MTEIKHLTQDLENAGWRECYITRSLHGIDLEAASFAQIRRVIELLEEDLILWRGDSQDWIDAAWRFAGRVFYLWEFARVMEGGSGIQQFVEEWEGRAPIRLAKVHCLLLAVLNHREKSALLTTAN